MLDGSVAVLCMTQFIKAQLPLRIHFFLVTHIHYVGPWGMCIAFFDISNVNRYSLKSVSVLVGVYL